MSDSDKLSKELGKQSKQIGRQILRNRGARRLIRMGIGKAAKFLKMIISKILGLVLKPVLIFLGKWILIILVLIILLLLVIESIKIFDINQRGGERTEAAILFDQTVQQVIKYRSQNSAGGVLDYLPDTQKDVHPSISSSWLHSTAKSLEPSWAIPSVLMYYKNLKDDNYKPWHNSYSKKDVSTEEKKTKAINDFTDVINKGFNYYFNDDTYKLEYSYIDAPREYTEIKETKKCQEVTVLEDGTEEVKDLPPEITETEKDLPKRQVVSEVELFYKKAFIQYKTHVTKWEKSEPKTKGDCTIEKEERHHLYIVDDAIPPQIEFNATTLVSFLVATAPEGKRTKQIHPKDLEYIVEMGKEIDDVFPTLSIDYEEFIKCAKKNSVESCVGLHVMGGFLGSTGAWYPAEYLEIYQKAADAYDVDWWILASIHGQETTFSTNPVATNASLGSRNGKGDLVGARGHFQFMPRTWLGWGFSGNGTNGVTKLGNITGPLDFITVPANIKKYNGYGVDANGDGKASPWDLEDSAHAAAKLLKANGYVKGNEEKIKGAIMAYNKSTQYVNEVYARGIMFRDGPVGGVGEISIADGVFTYPTTGRISSPYGPRSSGMHYGIDIGAGGRTFDVPIVAAADGEVFRNYFSSSYGWVMFIKHEIDGKKFETIYAHLDRKGFIAEGQPVKKGQTIGYMGNTGASRGKHLHFEIHSPAWNAGKTNSLNPVLYIPKPPAN